MVLCWSCPHPIYQCPPLAQRVCYVTTQKHWDGLFPNFVHTLVVIVPWPDYILKVIGLRWRSQGHKIMWLFFHIFISDHIFVLYHVKGLYNNIPWPFICPSVCLSFCSFTTFSGFYTFAVKRHKNIPWPFICPSIHLSVPFLSVCLFVHVIFRFLHICCHVTGKKCYKICHADVSSRHRCWWTLSFHVFIHLSNHPRTWVWVLLTNHLEEMTYNLSCCCFHVTHPQLSRVHRHMWVLFETLEEGTNIWRTVLKIKYGEDLQVSGNVSWTNENNEYTHEMWVLMQVLGHMLLERKRKGCKGNSWKVTKDRICRQKNKDTRWVYLKDEGILWFYVIAARHPLPAGNTNTIFFLDIHFWPHFWGGGGGESISDHTLSFNTTRMGIRISLGHSFVRPSICFFVHNIFRFLLIGCHVIGNKCCKICHGLELEYCWQITSKKWPTVCHGAVST